MKKPVYLDHAATTPIDPKVLNVMISVLRDNFGNPSQSLHDYGRDALKVVQQARLEVAELIGADPKEIVFTSGATESINLAIKGIAERFADRGNHIITCLTEHPATLNTCKYLESKGLNEITPLPVDPCGRIDLDQLEKAITDKTILITLMAANNEIGTTHPIEQIGSIAQRHGVMFHCDATQLVGKADLNVKTCNIDLLTLSAHKIYGPKGAGALFVRHSYPPAHPIPLLHGGQQEQGLRSGTLNVPGIVGLGAACRLCRQNLPDEPQRLKNLTEKLYQGLTDALDQVTLNGHPTEKVPNILNLSFAGVEGEALALALKNLAVSTGSACRSARLEPSHVLWALKRDNQLSQSSIRFSTGRFNTPAEIDYAVDYIAETVKKLRHINPRYPS